MFGIAQLERSPVTAVLVLIIGLCFLGQQAVPNQLEQLGLLYGPNVARGEWWRLVSWGFLHGGWMHVGFNGFLLFALGPQLERAFGSARFAILYFGSLFGGALAVMVFDWSQPTLGASGAVLGIAAALAIALWLRGADLRQTPAFGLVLLNLALPLILPGISFWGHLGGVLAGAAMAYLVTRGAKTSPVLPNASGSVLAFGSGAVLVLAALSILAAQLVGR
jgi:membrane associated rhomboid family serine protease